MVLILRILTSASLWESKVRCLSIAKQVLKRSILFKRTNYPYLTLNRKVRKLLLGNFESIRENRKRQLFFYPFLVTMEFIRLGVAAGCGSALTLAMQHSKYAGSYFARHTIAAGWGVTLWASGLVLYRLRRHLTLPTARWLHAGLMTAGALLMDYSVYVMWNVKEEKKRKHYKTWHGQIALTAALVSTVQAAGSWWLMYPTRRASICNNRETHRWMGYGIMVLSTAALSIGWWKSEVIGKSDIYRPLGLVGCLLLGGAVSL